ncbi:unnamed protein product [Blepharisma stoltei]|uniref:MI domain-containing protein n=1 Tax=Blepharisma stoltei TaxID=1481888 RepID=A0AAU9K2F2_9CILI|nr:unnamed protein product [Blepharisma stoltei]
MTDIKPMQSESVYIPPFRLAQMQKEIKDKKSPEYQKLMWDLLRKSINGIINKVNISNISNVIFELFNENLLRGKGLLTKAILKAQMAAPNFTHVYAALISVINTKLPEIGILLLHRVILQFQRSYKRNDKLLCIATTKMIAHLVNQQVVNELLALQIMALLLEKPTEDSVEIATDFMIECGQVLTDLSPTGVNAIFDRFRGILQEGETNKRVQYTIENLMAIRKTKFRDHPGVLQELDLVEDADKITHEISLDDSLDGQEILNVFKFDENFENNEEEWAVIKREILGEENYLGEGEEEESEEEEEEDENEGKIKDYTERDLLNLRKTIYLSIMSSVGFEECANKMLKLKIREGQEGDIAAMILECCMQERTYLRFFGLLSQRFCMLNPVYQEHFQYLLTQYYQTIHRLETNKLRNLAKFFAHLLFTDAISWCVFRVIRLTEEDTTSSSRIFIKIVMQEIAENLSIEKMQFKFKDEELMDCFQGIFPKDLPKHTRFAINFFTSIGLGSLTDELREFLKNAPQQAESSSSSSSSSSSEGSSSESSESESESEIEQKKNKEAADRFLKREIENEVKEKKGRENKKRSKTPPRRRRSRSRSNERRRH